LQIKEFFDIVGKRMRSAHVATDTSLAVLAVLPDLAGETTEYTAGLFRGIDAAASLKRGVRM